MKFKNIIKEKIKGFGIIETIVFVVYIIIVLFLATRHECWQDEAQSWLIARDLNPIQILEQLKYEGHSFLWYYILMPFAKLGFPMKVQNYVSAIFSIATVYLVLKKAPFGKILKILITFSGGVLYFYGIMSRPYCMIPLLLVGIAILYKNKTQHSYLYAILIGLLAHTHLVMIPTSILLTIDFGGNELLIKHKEKTKEEKIKLIKSFFIVLICIIIYMIICIQAAFSCEIVNDYSRIKNISKTNEGAFQLIKNAMTVTYANLCGQNIVPLYYKVLISSVFLLICIGSKNNIKQACIFWAQFLFTLLIHSFFWMVMPIRLYIMIYTLVFWMWVYKEEYQKENNWIKTALISFILITNISVYKLVYQDIIGNFSTGEIVAKYIEKNIKKGACFICTENDAQQSIIGCLDKEDYKFYMLNSERFVTFITWDNTWSVYKNSEETEEIIKKLKEEYIDLYVISIFPQIKIENTECIFNTEDKMIKNTSIQNVEEVYYIYKFKQ